MIVQRNLIDGVDSVDFVGLIGDKSVAVIPQLANAVQTGESVVPRRWDIGSLLCDPNGLIKGGPTQRIHPHDMLFPHLTSNASFDV